MDKNLKNFWKNKKLNELGFVGRGISKHRPRNDPSLYCGDYPFIQTSDVRKADLYISNYNQTYNEKGLAQSKLWDPNTLCITIAANIAETAILKFKACFPDSIIGFIPDSDKADVKFIKYYIDMIKLSIQNVSKGTTQDNLSLNKLSFINFLVPPVNTQKTIASFLSVYDDLIENNNHRIKILEEIAKTIFDEWFVKFRFPKHENIRMVDSELRKIPEGWQIKKLSDICLKVVDGTHDTPKPVNKGYYLVTGKHIINGFIDFSKCYFISPEEHEKVMKRSNPEKGDVIFSNIGTLGNTTLVDHDFEFSIKNVALFKPIKPIYSNFIYLYFSSPQTLDAMEKKASGTSQKFFSLKFLRNSDLIMPTDDLIIKFNSIITIILKQRSLLNKENLVLRETRDMLIQKLISGEINLEKEINMEEGK